MGRRLCILAVLLLAAGCGSSARDAGQAPSQVRSATFRDDARPICAAFQRRLRQIHGTTPKKSDQVWFRIADAWSSTIQKLRRLDPPGEDRPRVNRMLKEFDHAVRAAREVPSAEGEMVLAPIALMLVRGGRGATIARDLGVLRCSPVPPTPTAAQERRWREEAERRAGG